MSVLLCALCVLEESKSENVLQAHVVFDGESLCVRHLLAKPGMARRVKKKK